MSQLPWKHANTFSICAVNPQTGETGVAVASRCLSVGGLVPFASPGVGAIASQAYVNPDFGPRGLSLLAANIPASQALQRLLESDITTTPADDPLVEVFHDEQMTEEGRHYFRDTASDQVIWLTRHIRQVGIVDRHGNAATHSGDCIFPWFGSITDHGFSCQGNMLTSASVIEAMAEAYRLAQRRNTPMIQALLEALHAAEDAGGDKRGKQAAGILVTRDRGCWTGSDRFCDVRVDDHPSPVHELHRILQANRYLDA